MARDLCPEAKADLSRLRRVTRRKADAEAETIALFERLRTYDPAPSFTAIGEAAGMSDVGVLNALKRAGKR